MTDLMKKIGENAKKASRILMDMGSKKKKEMLLSMAEYLINEAEFIIAKNRHGPTTTVKVAWNGDYTMFTNLETIRNDM